MLSSIFSKNKIIPWICVVLYLNIAYILLKASFIGMMDMSSSLSDGIYFLALNSLSFWMIISNSKARFPASLKVLLVFAIIQMFVLIGSNSQPEFILRLYSWIFVLFGFYLYLYRKPDVTRSVVVLLYASVLMLSIFSIVQLQTVRLFFFQTGINEVYWILLGLPLAYLIDNRLLKYLLIAVIGYTILLSVKSTAVLAMLSAILLTELSSRYVKGNVSKSTIWVILVAIFIVYIAWPLISDILVNTFKINWTDKYNSSIETEGSGRGDIWVKTLNMILNSDFPSLMLGHGHNSVYKVIGFSAHNDFLEVIYDYGVFSFFIYLSFYFHLFRETKKMVLARFKYSNAMIASFVLFLILSFFSHLIIYSGLLLILGFIWAICLSQFYKK